MDVEEHLHFEDKVDDMEVQDFQPLPRERSNTWHGDFVYLDSRPHEFSAISEKQVASPGGSVTSKLDGDFKPDGDDEISQAMQVESGSVKKGSVRRNAWGNASYAELIAQAIESSSEKRLTLTQIYEWMIKNIPYFQMRSDGPSSMGWKNSIRHNLSLHNQFSRVQNEGTGKSSWWVVNRNFVKSKVPRRRATMGDPAVMDRKRCRVNKRLKCQENEVMSNLDEKSRKIRTISEANEVIPESDTKSICLRKSSSQTVIPSMQVDDCVEKLKNIERIGPSESAEKILHWRKMEGIIGNNGDSSHSVPFRPSVSLAVQTSQMGFLNHVSNPQNSIILKVQPSNEQGSYFEATNLSSPILLYVTPAEKSKLLSSTNQTQQTQNSLAMHQNLSSGSVSGTIMSDLNKQTNQMSLGDSEPHTSQPTFHISERRRKMLMELLHSERFCQLRRQNPELNRKIIDMLQRKKNMLLTRSSQTNEVQELSSEQSHKQAINTFQTSFLPGNQTDWLSLKLDSAEETHTNTFPKNNVPDGKPEAFADSFEFGQSHSFQIDVDQTIGDMDFDGNIDDLFGANSLLLSCEDELSILSHEFS